MHLTLCTYVKGKSSGTLHSIPTSPSWPQRCAATPCLYVHAVMLGSEPLHLHEKKILSLRDSQTVFSYTQSGIYTLRHIALATVQCLRVLC